MLTQKNKEDIANIILDFCSGASNIKIDITINSILSVLSVDRNLMAAFELEKIEKLILNYRASRSLLENTIEEIYKICWKTNTSLSSNFNFPDPLLPTGNTFSLNNLSSLSVVTLKEIKTKDELHKLISLLVDKSLIWNYDVGPVGSSGIWYNVELALSGTLILFTYHEANSLRYLTPVEIILGFISEIYKSWSHISMWVRYDILTNRLEPK